MSVRAVVVIMLAVLAVAGCGSRTSLPHTQSGDAQQLPNFQLVTDIPIPANATMDNERSLILSDRDRWTGRVVMKLWQQPAEMVAFYQTQMPAFGWDPVMSVTSETSVLSYLRGDRAATVQIERAMLSGALVAVTVAPRQTMSAPAAPEPRNERVRVEPLGARR